ncbi:MAG: MoaD/ThiS family protein [Verrucomicrobiales bacterium]|nr:MoaD/ThiS family protein [Verrucomicrobiales bacterium]
MTITVLFFSLFRDKTGADSILLELPKGATTVADAMRLVFEKYSELESWSDKMLLAVNCEFAKPDVALKAGDELALMPPVQGG